VRPGEKIFEELLNPETRVVPTSHEKIMVVETTPIDFGAIQAGIRDLIRHAGAGDEPSLVTRLAELVPDYRNGKAAAGIPWEKRMRVLLAEDDPYTRMILKRILENSYQVYEVENGRQVARRIKECEPHLIILNHNLPGANVSRLCEKIKAENGKASTQILILAESDEKVSLETARALGADDRVYKPIPVHILEKRVDGLLKGKREK
jgi:CheY-like chemotaxis protein